VGGSRVEEKRRRRGRGKRGSRGGGRGAVEKEEQ